MRRAFSCFGQTLTSKKLMALALTSSRWLCRLAQSVCLAIKLLVAEADAKLSSRHLSLPGQDHNHTGLQQLAHLLQGCC